MCAIFSERCWVVRIPFVHMVKFKFLAHHPVGHIIIIIIIIIAVIVIIIPIISIIKLIVLNNIDNKTDSIKFHLITVLNLSIINHFPMSLNLFFIPAFEY